MIGKEFGRGLFLFSVFSLFFVLLFVFFEFLWVFSKKNFRANPLFF